MVELRKRPQRDPPAPAPAPKKSRASKAKAVPAPAPAEPTVETSTAGEAEPTTVVGKAKRAASKVKEAITGSEAGATESAAKQPSVEDAPPASVETGETGMLPETAGTAPSTTTIPAESGSTTTGSTGTAQMLTGGSSAETKRQRAKLKGMGVTDTVIPPPAQAAAPEASTAATTGTGDSATASAATQSASTDAKPIRGKAKSPGTSAGVTSPTTAAAPTSATTTEATAAAPAAAAAVVTSAEESRPPATEDLENPPETGKVDTSTTTAASPTSVETATIPLSPSSVSKSIPSPTTFGGPSPLQTHTGTSLTFADLLTNSTSGIIIFTYPRASTPGCTQQACAFRDNHESFAKTSGYSIYGLSTDSVKANMGFATKQGLQYPLLCDVNAMLTGALGMKKAGNAKGTVRGVVVVDKGGVVRVWFQGGPGKTVDAVKEFLAAQK